MAEILLSLTIIGVVAAITLPSLTGNINERTWNTQRKALYARFSQAVALMPSLNGYGQLTEDEDGNTTDNAAETFVTEGLSKVLKINNICDFEHLTDCGLPKKINAMYSNNTFELNNISTLHSYNSAFNYLYSQHDTKAAAFETTNGESILVYYNPLCQGNSSMNTGYVQRFMCANFVYDLNGTKGPNTVGKDIGFISAIYPSDPVVVAPMPATGAYYGTNKQPEANTICKTKHPDSRIPNIEELMAIFYNRQLLGINVGDFRYWSSTLQSDNGVTKALSIRLHIGFCDGMNINAPQAFFVQCINR